MEPGDPRGRVRGREPRGLHRATEPGSGGRPPALPPARGARCCRRRRASPSLLPLACAPRVRAGACVSVYEAVCMCVCVSAPGAPPAPPARRRVPLPLPPPPPAPAAARCWPRAALQPAPAAAPSCPEGTAAAPRTPPARGPLGEVGGALRLVSLSLRAPPHCATNPARAAPDGRSLAPGSAVEPATSFEVPFGSVPKVIEIHSVFSAWWPLEGVSCGLDTVAVLERRAGVCKNQEWKFC